MVLGRLKVNPPLQIPFIRQLSSRRGMTHEAHPHSKFFSGKTLLAASCCHLHRWMRLAGSITEAAMFLHLTAPYPAHRCFRFGLATRDRVRHSQRCSSYAIICLVCRRSRTAEKFTGCSSNASSSLQAPIKTQNRTRLKLVLQPAR
jgi:hypothetical protein